MTGMLVLKLAVTAAVVLGLSALAERVGPRIAGLLAGMPLGSPIVFFFVGLEQGPGFVARAATYSLAGLTATLALAYAYWWASARFRRWPLVLSSVAGLAGFGLCALVLSFLPLTIWSAAAVMAAAIAAAMLAMHAIPDAPMARRIRLTPTVLALRAATAMAVVLAVTGLAGTIGPRWAGLLSGFPMTFYPLLLVIHASHSESEVHALLRNFPFGLGGVVCFVLAARFSFEPLGVAGGTAVSMAAGIAYLPAYWAVRTLVRRLTKPARLG